MRRTTVATGADVPNVAVTARVQTTVANLTLTQGEPIHMRLSVSRPFIAVSEPERESVTMTRA